MAYDEGVAERVRELLFDRNDVVEKKMFGGLAFMVRGNMCVGIIGDRLMARVGADNYAEMLKLPHTREMDFTGKALKGFVYVSPEGFDDDDALEDWVKRCLRFVNSLPAK
jgi:TfoX/Sxy family transcriptional regulator of competence genes